MWCKRNTRTCSRRELSINVDNFRKMSIPPTELVGGIFYAVFVRFSCGFRAETVLICGGFGDQLFATLMVDREIPGTKFMEVNNMIEVEKDYASKGVAGAGLGLGIAGTALGLLGGNLGGLLGGWNGGNMCNENMPVNRYELSMVRELTNKDMEIAYLKGRDASKSDDLELYKYVDGKFACMEREMADQRVLNATTGAAISCLTGQVNGMQALLNSITKTVVPNSAICPGWGNVTVAVTPTTTT